MKEIRFLDENGSFTLEQPEKYGYLYFPLASETGLKSAVSPTLGGDAKIDQNTFLLEPVSVENLHNNRSSRNFWCNIKGKGCWSATGVSAEQMAERCTGKSDKSCITAGFMWQKVSRESEKYKLRAEVLSFVPVDTNVEVMQVKIKNIGEERVEFVPTAVIPLYGRSADNLRDHRHVTALLHRIHTTEYGVEVTPTLSFDERGHQKNAMTYFVYGMDENGCMPVDFYPAVDDFVMEGGNFACPYAVYQNIKGTKAGEDLEGSEAVGGLHFAEKSLAPGECVSYTILLGVTDNIVENKALMHRFCGKEQLKQEFAQVKNYWQNAINVDYCTGDKEFDRFMKWVSFQPMLRRLFGCSFLPHHDYGKGGRGWRDLWQDCLALLIMNPKGVRQMLVDNFAGVRMDGSNATIIGSKQGEFIADRNNITRVWMDHGVWPLMTTKLYIHQTGDLELLDEEVTYFKDRQIYRGTKTDEKWTEAYGCWQKTKNGSSYKGSILEHLLIQNLTAFYEVGEHNIMRLRGADWNDALDMAEERGESVAFTNAYAGNLADLADLLKAYQKKTGKNTVKITKALMGLVEQKCYTSVQKKTEILQKYLKTCAHDVSGEMTEVSIESLVLSLLEKSKWLMEHIRKQEWVEDKEGNGWFNGYYDNHGRQVEGEFALGVRMMLTGQVFSIMAGTAKDAQIAAIVKSADKYLYQKETGGYRLNTNFHEVKMDLGRMFGFAYGEKENGAVFSHMAVMYANALYKRGYVKEGFKALDALEKQAMDFKTSQIYPGIPEYFNAKGRGLYHYLTGAASWYMLTVITEMFGVRGEFGDLKIEPKLLAEQFDDLHKASVELQFAGKKWTVVYVNTEEKEYGNYKIAGAFLDKQEIAVLENAAYITIPKEQFAQADTKREHIVEILLG
ncbi:MAG: cellobiose phosphorylase [Lachnospiraceae bacterium]|nr:cellobiose phosphorylase [Lachnospiraceae bacterium]